MAVRATSTYAAPNRGPALSARLRSASTTVVAISVVGIAIILATWVNARAVQTAAEVSRSIEIRERAERFLGHLRDAETGQRGFLLGNSEIYLAPYVDGRTAALPELDALERLVIGDSRQMDRVEAARRDAKLKFEELDETIALARSGKAAEAIAAMRDGRGTALMDDLRQQVQLIQLDENVRLVDLYKREEQRRLFATVGILVALTGLAYAAWLQLKTRQRRTNLLAVSNAKLERMVSERTRELESERLRIEALLRDVSHRVGNNLAMVSALLNVQSRQTKEPAVKTALLQAHSRIQAIAAGQRRLRLDLETDEIDARPYMEDLLDEIGKAAEERPIDIRLDMDDIRLPGRDAVSFVVIVNELVTNAIKHAFPDDMAGMIVVRFGETADQETPALVLTVEDDGVGMGDDQDRSGLGQTVVASLLRSMHATMTTDAANPGAQRPGTKIAITFPRRST